MKKYKIVLLVLLFFFVANISFIGVDCVRLRNAQTGTKPLITLSEEITGTRVTYKGLGYSVCYYTDSEIVEGSDGTAWGILGYGAEFRLFGSVLLWAWAE